MQRFNRIKYDAIIIGARCAGAATAMLMARHGARVLIIDRDTETGDTLSTHALMRAGVTLLDHWGLLGKITAAGTPIVRNTQFHYGAHCIDIPIKPAGNVEGLYAPRRWLLDRTLQEAAVAAGAELRMGTRLVKVLSDAGGRVVGAELRHPDGSTQQVYCDILIGADGRHSSVAESVDAKVTAQSAECSATVYTYVSGIENQGYRWYFGDKTAAGLIPTTQGKHCLFTSCAPDAFGAWFREDAFGGALKMLATWEPDLAADLAARGADEKMRRFPGAGGHIRNCVGPGWALVGDAGYFKDPATAHGITDAFLDASRLAHAFCVLGDASAYQLERDVHAPKFFEITQKIASLDWDFNTLKGLHMDLNLCMKAEQSTLPKPSRAMAA